jgi:hypothetical protein
MAIPNPAWDLNRSINLQCGPKKAWTLEVLQTELLMDTIALLAATAAAIQAQSYCGLVASQNPTPPIVAGAGYIATIEWIGQLVRDVPQQSSQCLAIQATQSTSAATPTGSPYNEGALWIANDTTDGAGHGILVGAQLINVNFGIRFSVAPGFTGQSAIGVRIKYRYKAIPYDEWVRQFTFGI